MAPVALFALFALGACSQGLESRTAVSQTALTSADVTDVTMSPPPDSKDRPLPKRVATPIQRQMEEEDRGPTPAAETTREWGARYPDSAKLLADWARQYPKAAERLSHWEAEQPDHVRVLVLWAVTNRFDTIDSFMMDRGAWDELLTFREREPQAFAELLHLVRSAPKATTELVLHSPGFGAATAARGVPRATVAGATPVP